MASNVKVQGKHLLSALRQMRNRGNGKGGGIAAAGLSPNQFGVTQQILEEDYLIAIAYLDESVRSEVESQFITPLFDVDHVYEVPTIDDSIFEVRPPKAIIYFTRFKGDGDDETVYQNSYQLNKKYYASVGDKKAFVLSHGKNVLVLKMVGFGDDVIEYYKLENLEAHVWIGHHRYPTKGRVWHPGGAHPFVGMNEALVHNGDFANYHSICEYLAQRNIHPLFLTDTEVSALLFDLLHRTYKYPLEYVIEALAPTTERDYTLLPAEKQSIYKLIQQTHMHGSPDGPWFFLIAQSLHGVYSLLGITDTSMLRPQVFALQEGEVSIGLAASEKQAIDAALLSLSNEDRRFLPTAGTYWNARGGSHTDGGAFIFEVSGSTLRCYDKFGKPVKSNRPQPVPSIHQGLDASGYAPEGDQSLALEIVSRYRSGERHLVVYNCRGQRFIGNGLGPNSKGFLLEVYGSSGDYLASGIDGATIVVYGNAQDQVAQIMLSGTLVIHGDVGQTFMYGAKGGKAFVKGNTAGRPLINAVGNPRVVINGTCLDYLAESFMAGNPLQGGGFAILNGVQVLPNGTVEELPSPYPGSNLFSLASGGAIYIRDPAMVLSDEQLNGGVFAPMTEKDWELILPYLKENEAYFHVSVSRLLEWQGKTLPFHKIYRKVAPSPMRELQEEEAWVKVKD